MMTHPFDLRSICGEQQAAIIKGYCSHQFYLPPGILEHPDIEIGAFDIYSGPRAAWIVSEFAAFKPTATIQGDLPLELLELANTVGVSVRRYRPDNSTHLVYKLWNRKDSISYENS